VSEAQELENETTPRFEVVTQSALQEASGLRGQGRIAGFSSAAARSSFVLDTGPSHGLINIYQLNYLSRINAGAYALHQSAEVGSSTVQAVTVGVTGAFYGEPYLAPVPTVSHWSGGTQRRFMATSTADTATTFTISTLFDPTLNTSTTSLLRDALSDSLARYNR
jgi:hypothetical protein